MAVKNKKKKKDEKLAKRSWLDAYGSMSEGLGELADQVIDPTNDLQVGLAALRKSGLVGMLAEHLKNRRDAKAAAQYTDENPIGDYTPDYAKELAARRKEAAAMNMDPDKPFLSEWNTDMGIKDTAKVIPGSGTVLPQSNEGITNSFFGGADSVKNIPSLSGGVSESIGKISPNIGFGVQPAGVMPFGEVPALNLDKLGISAPESLMSAGSKSALTGGAGATTAAITPAAALGIASLAVGLLGGNKKQTYGSTAQPQNPMGQGGKEDDWLMPSQQAMQIASHREQKDKNKRRPYYRNPYMA